MICTMCDYGLNPYTSPPCDNDACDTAINNCDKGGATGVCKQCKKGHTLMNS